MNHIKHLFTNELNYQVFLNETAYSKMNIQIEEEQALFTFKIHDDNEEIPEHLKCLNYQTEIHMSYKDIREALLPFYSSADSFEKAVIQQFKVYNHMIEHMEDKNEQAKIYQHEFSALKQLSHMLQLIYLRIYLINHALDFVIEKSEDIIFSEVRRNYLYFANHKFKTINELNVYVQMFWSNCTSSLQKYFDFCFFHEELSSLNIKSNGN